MARKQTASARSKSSTREVAQEPRTGGYEISLREYVDIVVKRRKLVLSVFAVTVIGTAVASFLMPQVYEASGSIMVSPSRLQTALAPSRISLDIADQAADAAAVELPKPTISVSTHETLVKSNAVLQRVLDKLSAAGEAPEELTLEELSDRLTVARDAEETNVLRLSARDSNAVRAKDMVNIWADEYLAYSRELIGGEVAGSGTFILEQFNRAEQDLAAADKAVKDFEAKERLSLMELELKESEDQLRLHYAKVHKLGFTLAEKRHLLKKVDEDIAAMSHRGVWLGSYSISELEAGRLVSEGLTEQQKQLRKKVVEAKRALETSQKRLDDFISQSGFNSLKAQVERTRQALTDDRVMLAAMKQLSEATAANLKSGVHLQVVKEVQGPLAENMSDLTIWEVMSLAEGYNFFETRVASLTLKLQEQDRELREVERTLLEYTEQHRILAETLARVKLDYGFYHDKFKALMKNKHTMELEISDLENELAFSRDIVEKLESKVETLKTAINDKKLTQADLKREFDIASRAYELLASKVEEARIAMALELGEVKIVSAAFEPKQAVWPRKMVNVSVAGLVGLLFGVLGALYREFREKNGARKGR